MATEVKYRRGTTAQHAAFTGAFGEMTIDTTKNTCVVHDGSTAGGFPLARESAVASKLSNVADDPSPQLGGTLETAGYGIVMEGNILPEMSGATGNVSVRNIGSPTQQFNSIYADEVFVGASSLYVNNKKVIEDVSNTMEFKTDADQSMNIKTVGAGNLNVLAENEILLRGDSGVELQIPATNPGSDITVSNAATNGTIAFTTTGTNGEIQFTSSAIEMVGPVTITGDLEVTGTLTGSLADVLVNSNNLSDVSDAGAARTNLGLVAGGAGDVWVEKGGDSMSGPLNMGTNKITSLDSPTDASDAANKAYVDGVASNLSTRRSVHAATTANLSAVYDNGTNGVGATLTGSGVMPAIDGETIVVDDRILVKAQTAAAQNGIYKITAITPNWTAIRCDCTDEDTEVSGAFTFVEAGTSFGKTGWVLSVDDPSTFTIGTDDIEAIQFSTAGEYTAGTGLSLAGTTFNVNLGAGIKQLPTDEVGIDLYDTANGGLILTEDGSTSSTGTAARLHIKTNSTLLQNSSAGLRVNPNLSVTSLTATSATVGGNSVLTSADTGTGNGLDADLLDGLQSTSFVRGDAVNNAEVTITANDADFSVQDTTEGTYKYIWRDHSAGRLFLGLDTGAFVEFRSGVDFGQYDSYGMRTLTFTNQEPTDLTTDGMMGFDSSRGMIVYRTQVIGDASGAGGYTVLDSSNIAAGANITITGTATDEGGTTPITFAVDQGSGSGLDADTVDGIEAANLARTDTEETFNADVLCTTVVKAGGSTGNAAIGTETEGGHGFHMEWDATNSRYKHHLNFNDGGGNWNMRIAHAYVSGSGLVCSEASYPFAMVHSQGNGSMIFYTTDTAYAVNDVVSFNQTFTFAASGNFTASGNVTAYSDERVKTNIKTIDNAVDKVKQLRGVEFDRTDMKNNDHQIGVIAQEVEKVIPEVVIEQEDGMKSVAYGNMVGLLIEAMKEQQAQIDAQNEQINSLKEEINALKGE